MEVKAVSQPPSTATIRRLHAGLRPLLMVFSLLTLVATNQLYVLAGHTQDYFAWTIKPPISAAFLGAGYAAGCILVVTTLRVQTWAQARLPVLTVLVFTVLTLVATVMSRSRFHWSSDGLVARGAAWFWLAVYVVVPVWMGWLLVQQRRAGEVQEDSRVPRRVQPRWLKSILAAQGGVLIVVGAVLFVAPATQRTLWAWQLTPLTARTIAAWVVSFGLAALLASLERDLVRVRFAALAYAIFALLQVASLLRFRDSVRWSEPATSIYLVLLAVVVATGAAGYWRARPAPGPPDSPRLARGGAHSVSSG